MTATVPVDHLQPVEDPAVLDLLGLPDLGVEVAVDLRRVRQHRGELEHVAIDLELNAGHEVQHVAEPLTQHLGGAHGEVDRLEAQRRMGEHAHPMVTMTGLAMADSLLRRHLDETGEYPQDIFEVFRDAGLPARTAGLLFAVTAACVFGVPDARWGQIVCAAVLVVIAAGVTGRKKA